MRKREVTLIACACGCGTMIESWKRGRPCFYARHHQLRKPDFAARHAEVPPPGEIDCACGCGYKLFNRDDRGRPRKFLTGHHSRLQPNQRELVPCENCGNTVIKAQWELKRGDHHFCGQVCAGEWATKNGIRRGENNGHYNTITVPCAGCSDPITKAVSLIMRRNNRVYCGDCAHLFKGGKKGFYVGYPSEFSSSLRRSIRKRDGYICQLCGKDHEETGTLHVHHIDYDKHNNNPVNLISLCCVCHGQTNYGTEKWRLQFQAFQAARGL